MISSTRFFRYALVLALVPAAFFPLFAAPRSLLVDAARPSVDHAGRVAVRPPGNDLTWVFLPRFVSITRHLRQFGRIPQWDDSGFGGRPMVGNPQAGLAYPPYWLALSTGRPESLGWLTLIHLVVAGMGACVLAREGGVSEAGAALAGGVFALCPYVIGHVCEGHYPHVWAVSWYPWTFWCAALVSRGHRTGLLGLPVFLALSLLAGHPQEWYYLVIAIVIYALIDLWRLGRTPATLSRLAVWLLAGAASLLIGAVELVPDGAVSAWGLEVGRIPLRMIGKYHLRGSNLFQLFSPFALGRPHEYFGQDNYWETVFSIGLLPLSLAALGIATSAGRQFRRFWTVTTLLSAVFAAGPSLYLFSLAYLAVPGMDRFRVPGRALFLASLGGALLAGSGFDALKEITASAKPWPVCQRFLSYCFFCFIILFIIVSFMVEPYDQNPGRELSAAFRLLGEPILWLALTAAFLAIRFMRRAWAAECLGAIALLELVLYARALVACAPIGQFAEPADWGAFVSRGQEDRAEPLRVAAVPTLYGDLRASMDGVEKISVNDGFQLQHAANYYESLYPLLDPARVPPSTAQPMDGPANLRDEQAMKRVLDLMSARFLISGAPLPGEGWRKVGEPSWRIAENLAALPMAYVVPNVRVTPPGARGIAATIPGFDPRREVCLAEDPLPAKWRQPFLPARWIESSPDRVVLSVENQAPGILVLSRTWMPGWSASVDGESAPVLMANGWQQAVALGEAGPHRVVLIYHAPGLFLGISLSLSALVAWALLAAAVAVNGRRKRNNAHSSDPTVTLA